MDELGLPALGLERSEVPRQIGQHSAVPTGTIAQSISQRCHLAGLQSHGALREPANTGAERLLTQFHAAAVVGRLEKHNEQSLGVGRGNRSKNRFRGVRHTAGSGFWWALVRTSLNAIHFIEEFRCVNVGCDDGRTICENLSDGTLSSRVTRLSNQQFLSVYGTGSCALTFCSQSDWQDR